MLVLGGSEAWLFGVVVSSERGLLFKPYEEEESRR